jgi:type VI secretion system protein ImpA
MAFPFDIDTLLSPITPDEPAGVSLRYDPVYDRLRELRREDDSSLPQGVWKSEQKRADWKALESLCLETLETQSKDLQIGAWLLEAWLHLYGFPGVREGFRAMLALSEKFWDTVHPRMEAGDMEFRIAPFVWLDRKLPADLRLLPVTRPDADGIPAFTLADWEIACQMESLQNRPGQQGASANRDVTMARFQQSAMLTPTVHLSGTLDDVRDLLRACAALQGLLDKKLEKESPGMLAVRSAGEGIASLLEALLRERGVAPVTTAQAEMDSESPVFRSHEPEHDVTEGQEFEAGTGGIQTRAEAYQMLVEAADFLSRTEPHSPTPYLVRRAILWGSMSLEDLLPELVRNPSELGDIYRLLNLHVRGNSAD